MNISIVIESDIIRSYRRLAYSPWHALAEFVDNSTQSYLDNEAALRQAYTTSDERFEVRITYDRNADFLRIADNAMGMSFQELEYALKIGKPPTNISGRSQFGMGMKTAACWLGNLWEVRTKKLGEEVEHLITVDVEKVAGGNLDLDYRAVPKKTDLHYTILEIRGLNRKFQGRRLGKIKEFLRSMYRVDIRNGVMDLYWQDGRLEWDHESGFLEARDGSLYRKDFDFAVDGNRVYGWVGILGEGRSGRPNAGFSILRRGRVVRGHPDAWRPEEIFGWQGRNDLINQRIRGEINLDDFGVSHTKDDILWVGNQEDEVQSKLKDVCADYIRIARQHRKGRGDVRGPSDAEVQTAVDELQNEMQSKEFVDLIELDQVPPPEVIAQVNKPIVEAAKREEPNFNVRIGTIACKVYLSTDESPNDPYFVTDITPAHILVIVNTRHPHWSELDGAAGVLNYLRHCVYDAIAEWQAGRRSSPLLPSTIKVIKDRLLRLPAEIEQASGIDGDGAELYEEDIASYDGT